MTGLVEEYGGRATLPARLWQYNAVIDQLCAMDLQENDLIVDVGAGNCDLDYVLRRRDWVGRYLPLDGMIDPTVDLEHWSGFHADFFVCIDTVEHLRNWECLVERMQGFARKGVVVATPDGDTIDVFAMHPTHLSSIRRTDLEELDMAVREVKVLPPEGSSYIQLVAHWEA